MLLGLSDYPRCRRWRSFRRRSTLLRALPAGARVQIPAVLLDFHGAWDFCWRRRLVFHQAIQVFRVFVLSVRYPQNPPKREGIHRILPALDTETLTQRWIQRLLHMRLAQNPIFPLVERLQKRLPIGSIRTRYPNVCVYDISVSDLVLPVWCIVVQSYINQTNPVVSITALTRYRRTIPPCKSPVRDSEHTNEHGIQAKLTGENQTYCLQFLPQRKSDTPKKNQIGTTIQASHMERWQRSFRRRSALL